VNEPQQQAKYDPIVKTLHWTWAFVWIAVWSMGILAVYWREALNSYNQLTTAHKAFGMALLVLIALRVIWRLVRKPPPLVVPMTDAERAAHGAHLMLYAVAIFALPLSGWIWSSVAGEPITLLELVKIPPLMGPAPDYYGVAKWTHLGIAWVTGLLVLAHILMALKRHFVDRDQTLRNMLPGRSA
jgi:cytochrome b561